MTPLRRLTSYNFIPRNSHFLFVRTLNCSTLLNHQQSFSGCVTPGQPTLLSLYIRYAVYLFVVLTIRHFIIYLGVITFNLSLYANNISKMGRAQRRTDNNDFYTDFKICGILYAKNADVQRNCSHVKMRTWF